MRNKVVMLVLAGLIAFTVNGFALKGTPDFAIGGELTSINFDGVVAMMTLHIPNVPLFFGIGADFSNDVALAMTVHYWLMHQQISGMLEWYLGVGAQGQFRVHLRRRTPLAPDCPSHSSLAARQRVSGIVRRARPRMGSRYR